MKILKLRFKNLNSLYGEWFIDFTSAEYQSNGLFALTGPTGSGKSTILDAICLALYGETPRLGKITKNTNELMSRQTGECYAEVVFEAKSGTFRCHWSQHRARKKATGKLADAKHEIANAINGQILETKKREVAISIEEKTGMDFDRFTRSILLAQGRFDTFLKANAEQKSRVLEQITGTEIYSKISIRVHEQHKSEREKLLILQAKISGIDILSDEQETELQNTLLNQTHLEETTNAHLQNTTKAIIWLTKINELTDDIIALNEEDKKQTILIEAFKEQRKELEWAVKASHLEGVYARLLALRQQQKEEHTSLINKKNQVPEIEASLIKTQILMKEAEQATLKAKETEKYYTPIIQKTRLLDQQIADKAELIKTSQIDGRLLSKQLAKDISQQKQNTSNIKTIEQDIMSIDDYFTQYSADELLVTQFSAIEAQLKNIQSLQNNVSEKESALKSAEKNCKGLEKKHLTASNHLISHNEHLKQAKQQLDRHKKQLSHHLNERLLREYRTEKESLLREKALLTKIASLSDERNKLQDGKACPLCGAKDHPYAQGNIPLIESTDQKINTLTQFITQAELIEEKIKDSEKLEQKASKELTHTEKKVIRAKTDDSHAQEIKKELNNMLNKEIQHCDQLKQETLITLQPLDISSISLSNINTLLLSLEAKLKNWQAQKTKKHGFEQQYHQFNRHLEQLKGLITAQQQALNEKNQHTDQLQDQHKQQSTERTHLLGTKNPNKEENHLKQAVFDAERIEKQQNTHHEDAKHLLSILNNDISTLTQNILNRSNTLEDSEKHFIHHLKTSAFIDESTFINSRLSIEKRDQLSLHAKKLDDKKIKIQGKKLDREEHLAQEHNKKITELDLITLESKHKEIDNHLKQIINDIATLKLRLDDNKLALKRIKKQKQAIDQQQEQCRKWAQLHNLIGSADGKKFRTFAQGLTFERMVSYANKQLEKMTDRYLLIRDNNKPLELNVIDHYQAGEIRSTKNLSGGESFIISLTLALGLSKMASHKVRVDSLFLDEGFGTLDEEALETALETLSVLQQDGKIIGIISHVTALKERISTQIAIQPLSGGKSSISGVGCQSIPAKT